MMSEKILFIQFCHLLFYVQPCPFQFQINWQTTLRMNLNQSLQLVPFLAYHYNIHVHTLNISLMFLSLCFHQVLDSLNLLLKQLHLELDGVIYQIGRDLLQGLFFLDMDLVDSFLVFSFKDFLIQIKYLQKKMKTMEIYTLEKKQLIDIQWFNLIFVLHGQLLFLLVLFLFLIDNQ